MRRPDGALEVASEPKPELAPGLAAKLPGLRGPLKLAEALAVLPLVRRRMPAARLPFEDRRVVAAIGATLVAHLGRCASASRSSALREGVVQAIGAVPAIVALLDRDLAAYHGVEHKAIAAYEQGIDDPAGVPKEHDRCGSNLLAPMMLLSAGGTVMLERLVERPSPAARAVVGLAGASIAVEMFAWSDRHHGDPLAEAFHTPGREIQRLIATKEPTPSSSRSASPPWPRSSAPRTPRRLRASCSEGSTTSASPSRTRRRPSSSTRRASGWSWACAKPSRSRASRRRC